MSSKCPLIFRTAPPLTEGRGASFLRQSDKHHIVETVVLYKAITIPDFHLDCRMRLEIQIYFSIFCFIYYCLTCSVESGICTSYYIWDLKVCPQNYMGMSVSLKDFSEIKHGIVAEWEIEIIDAVLKVQFHFFSESELLFSNRCSNTLLLPKLKIVTGFKTWVKVQEVDAICKSYGYIKLWETQKSFGTRQIRTKTKESILKNKIVYTKRYIQNESSFCQNPVSYCQWKSLRLAFFKISFYKSLHLRILAY